MTFIRGGLWSGLVWSTQSILQVFLFVVFFRPVSFSSVVLQFLCLPQLLEINMLTLFSARPANVLIKTCSDSSLLAAGMFGLQNLNSHEHVSVYECVCLCVCVFVVCILLSGTGSALALAAL